jgi:hypothetical protein
MIWISTARRGRTHDITAARRDHLLAHLRTAVSAPWPVSGFWASSA